MTRPGISFAASRTIRRSTRRTASGPRSSYLKSGLTSMSAAASRIALTSMTCDAWYALAAKKPDHSRHWRPALRGAVRGWKAVPTVTSDAPPLGAHVGVDAGVGAGPGRPNRPGSARHCARTAADEAQ